MLKNIINSHCAFNLKETQVCVRAKTQNAEGLQLILSTSVWSKTVYHKYIFLKLSMGLETVCPEKDRQTAFYSPLPCLQDEIQSFHWSRGNVSFSSSTTGILLLESPCPFLGSSVGFIYPIKHTAWAPEGHEVGALDSSISINNFGDIIFSFSRFKQLFTLSLCTTGPG